MVFTGSSFSEDYRKIVQQSLVPFHLKAGEVNNILAQLSHLSLRLQLMCQLQSFLLPLLSARRTSSPPPS